MMIPIAKPQIGEEELKAVQDVMNSGIISQGEAVGEFEENFAGYIGVENAVAVNSGTAALHLALLANGIGAGDEVITTPFTFIATANSILFTGARPVFVDIEEDTFNINAEKIRDKITPRTKAIMPVHLYGQPADMKTIMETAEDHNLIVIEDACQAHGAEFKKIKVGNFGTGCFSFYPTKNMTTSEGGIITTNDKKIADTAGALRNHGSLTRYYHEILGYNYRMTDIGASIGITQLKKLDRFNEIRIKNARHLTKRLKDIEGILTPIVKNDRKHVFNQYTIRIKSGFGERDKVIEILNKNGVGTAIYYPLPIHQQRLYLNLGYGGKFPLSEKMASEVLSLPVHPSVTEDNLDLIAETFNNINDGKN